MSLFDQNGDLWPTKPETIGRMLDPYFIKQGDNAGKLALGGKVVLEPQAGTGNIVDYVKDRIDYGSGTIYCVEKDENCRHVLQGKGHHLIGEDFLGYQGDKLFDLIIMNPPFSQGAKHLLKAWRVMTSGDIVCLLNKETLENPYTNERKLLKRIIEENQERAKNDYKWKVVEDYGQCFTDAERPTKVEVVCVRLKKTSKNYFDFNDLRGDFSFEDSIKFSELVKEQTDNQIVIRNNLAAREAHHNEKVRRFIELMIAFDRFGKYEKFVSNDIIDLAKEGKLQEFIDNQRGKSWSSLLKDSEFSQHMTKNTQEDFMSKFDKQKGFAFTESNMRELLQLLWTNKDDIMESCILDAFEYLTTYHKDNRMEIKGYSTNDAWRVNKRVVLHYCFDQYSFQLDYRSKIDDVDKAIAFLQGKKITDKDYTTIREAIEKRIKKSDKDGAFAATCESSDFEIRFYKNKNIHLKFKDNWIWQEFNKRACELKGFPLPSSEGESHYKRREREKANKYT